MTDDEVAAFHEAAHAVIAVSSEWTRLHGPTILHSHGGGDVTMATNVEAITRAIKADPGFDRDIPRIQLIRALLAGPIAERMLWEQGRAPSSEKVIAEISAIDDANVAEQMAALTAPAPDLLSRLEHEVRQKLEQPAIWAAVERFAAALIERRRLEVEEGEALLADCIPPPPKPVPSQLWLTLAIVFAVALLLWVRTLSP